MDTDRISVIVPMWNAGTYLAETLESLRTQTYADFEAILVNDGSTDDSESICLDFCRHDPRFRLMVQPNRGVSAARNAGIDMASGEWIAFLDADDHMFPDTLEVLRSGCIDCGAEIAVGGFVRRMPCKLPQGKARYKAVDPAEAVRIGLYQQKILNNPWGTLFHRSIFSGPDPVRFRSCRYEDLDLFYRAFERARHVCLVDRPVYCYRDAPGSFINSWSPARLDVLDVTDRIVSHYAGTPKLLKAAADRRFSAHYNMLLVMERYAVDDEEQKRRCREVIKKYRLAELLDPQVRLKNKIGALVSYLGHPAIKLLSRLTS